MASASLYLPLVSWHHYTNPTTTALVYRHPHVYAGQKDGHIWVYTLEKESLTLKHKYLFTGHKAAISALCILKSPDADTPSNNNNNNATEDVLLSADETGEIARWNTMDGRCQAVNPNGFFGTPTQLKVFPEISQHYIFCSGQSNEICILNASNLEVVRVWGGHANWITCTNFYDQCKYQEDKNDDTRKQRLMTATLDGQLDLWDMDVTMPVLYREKKLIKNQPRIQNTWNDGVLDLMNHPTESLFLMLTRRQATVFALTSTNQWVPQCTLAASKEWVGVAWAGKRRLVLWSSDGNVADYILESSHGVSSGAMVFEESQIYYSAKLSTTYLFNNDENTAFPDGLVSTLCVHTDDADMSILTVCNRSDHDSSFSMNILAPLENLDSENTVTRNKEISFQSIWPMQQFQEQPYGSITTTIPVSSNHLAIGYENGTICIVPLSIALLHLNQLSDPLLLHRQDTRLFEKAHHGKVTCLLIPEHHGSSNPCEQKHLLSGGRDGCVKIWNIINGKFVASFTVHASPVASFVEPAEQNDSKIRGCVVSIAHDNSLALISVDSMTCLYIIPGYTYPLVQIQWRPSEDYVLFAYSDDAVFVWQLKAGHLDRILSGKTPKQVMADSRWPSNRIQSSSRKTNANTNHTVHTKSILSKSQDLYTDKLFAQVFLFNIRRLVFDLKDSGRLPANAYHHSLNGSTSTATTSSSTTTFAPQPALSLSSTLLLSLSTSPSTNYSPELADPLDTTHDDDMDTTTTSSNKSTHDRKKSGGNKHHNENKEQYLLKKRELVSVVMSIIASSGAPAESQGPFEKLWPLTHGSTDISTNGISDGIRGVNGYLSLTAPTSDAKHPWTDSSTLTATRLLSMAFLMKAIDKSDGGNQGTQSLFADYVKDLGHHVGSQYSPPSLSLLSRYWQDAEARSIFSMAMTELDSDQLRAFVDYWKNYLPVSSSLDDTDTQMMTRATIVLGIIGCDQPHVLNDQVRKSTALSLTLLLSDTTLDDMMHQDNSTQQDATTANKTIDSVTLTRILSSMELLGQGFTTWEVYINASNVLRTLFAYANQKDPAATTNISSITSRQAIRQGANHAIFTIAKNNHMPLVIGTLTFDSTHAKKIDHRLGCLKIISSFIRKNPLLLYGHVYRVIEAVVKTLDPNVPHMRESMLVAATATLHDLVNRYSSVDFSSSAQKLVVGTLEGATVVYDLQTATRSAVFEGHTGPVSVVKFSPDAKWIATGSLLDHTVRVWHSQLSLLGMFTNSLTHRRQAGESGASTTASGSQKPYKVFSFALPENSQVDPDSLQFEWPSNRCVKLRIKDIVMSFNV